MNSTKLYLALFAVVCSLSTGAWAGSAETEYQRALTAFEGRADQAKTQETIDILEAALETVQDEELEYKMLNLAAHAYVWKGSNATGDSTKKEIYEAGMEHSSAALELDDEYADAYYWQGILKLLWVKSLGDEFYLIYKNEVINLFKDAIDRFTIDDEDGQEIDGWGPVRLLGVIYAKLPAFAGGSLPLGLKKLDKARQNAPGFALNELLYWEAFSKKGSAQKTEACDAISSILKRTPDDYDMTRVPESQLELFEGCKVYKKECGKPSHQCVNPFTGATE